MKTLIVSRHPAAIEFIRRNDARFRTAPVLESATADDIRGAVAAGNLPLHLASLAAMVIAVEFAGAPPRGTEYGLPEMEAAGARLVPYVVRTPAAIVAEVAGAHEAGCQGYACWDCRLEHQPAWYREFEASRNAKM